MERTVLLRSLSSSSLACNKFLFSAPKHSRSFLSKSSSVSAAARYHRRFFPNRSLLRRNNRRSLPVAFSHSSLHFGFNNKHFSSLSPRAVASPPTQPSPIEVEDEVEDKLGFEKVSEEFIGECKSKAVLFKHKKTGAEVMSVSNDDENKVFGIVFRTPPKDSTGIPHILEHSVLCGSRRYPLKEPFVELLKGSLHTFLNAFTYPDRTCYPVTSTNTKKLFSEPVRIVEKYSAGEGGDLKKKHMVCLNWLLSDKPLDLQTELTLGFMDHLMLGTPASPLRKVLLESGLGDAIIGAVEASMNTIEFSLRENNTGSFPRGLSLMLRSIGKWIYDMDPFEPLKYEKPLTILKARIAEEGSKAVFSPLIEKFILNNPHCVTIEMQPDPKKSSCDEAAEKEILEKVLKLKQETPDPPEALRSVPSLSLHDIPKEPICVPTEVGDINGVKVLQHDLFTNDVLYTEVVFDMSSLKQELLPLVPLFCQSLLEMGTKDLTFVQLNQLIGRKTGGISVYPFTSSTRGKEDPCSLIIVRGKSMIGRADDLFNLINCVIQEVQFTDQQRFKQFVSQSKAKMENQLRGGGHGIAAARMDAKLNVAGWISEQMGGVR
ncbi:hypothetical protein CRYUN_Cryun06bG0049000 [Craigia yunnanensis]